MIRPGALAALVACLVLSTTSTDARAGHAPLGPDRALDLEFVSDPQLSPDGGLVLYTRGRANKLIDRVQTRLWLLDLATGRDRMIVEGTEPRWSPDGSRIAFIAADSQGRAQVFVRWMDAMGTAGQVTSTPAPVRDVQWSPDGQWLSFRMPVTVGPEVAIPFPYVPSVPGGAEPPRVIDTLPYRLDRLGIYAGAYEHLFVVPAEGGAERQLTAGRWHVGSKPAGFDLGTGTRWAPDGTTIYFDGLTGEQPDPMRPLSHIYKADVASGAMTQVTREPGFWTAPAPSPDGRWIAYAGFGREHADKSFKTRELWVSRSDGTAARNVSLPLDGDAEDVVWAPDSDGLWFTMELRGHRHVYYTPLAGAPRQLTPAGFVGRLASRDAGGRRLAAVSSTGNRPGEVVILDARRPGRVQQVTHVNREVLEQVELGQVEELSLAAPDGTPLQGWVVKPPAFDPGRRYPFILEIHGGPHDAYNAGFSRYFQALAARGYVVLYMNPRGSRGYGSEFGNAIQNSFPGQKDYEDLMAGVDAVLARGYVDAQRLFVTGCSAGGAMTAWIVAHTKRFAAAAALCPIANWLSFAGTTDVAAWGMRRFDKPFWEDPSAWLEHSPIMHVGSIETPLLIMTGEDDLRTPMSQSEELFAALKMRGIPTRLVQLDKESHGTTSVPSNFVRTILYLDGWFAHWDPVLRLDAARDSGVKPP